MVLHIFFSLLGTLCNGEKDDSLFPRPLHRDISITSGDCRAQVLGSSESSVFDTIPEEEKNLDPHSRLIHFYHFMDDTAQNQAGRPTMIKHWASDIAVMGSGTKHESVGADFWSIVCIIINYPRGKWYCKYCESMLQREKFAERNANALAAARVSGVDSIEQITNRCIYFVKNAEEAEFIACVLCRAYDFSKPGFGPWAVILCDQELPKGKCFCSTNCKRIYSALQNLLNSGEERLPDSCLDATRDGFNPIVDSVTGRDFSPFYGLWIISMFTGILSGAVLLHRKIACIFEHETLCTPQLLLKRGEAEAEADVPDE
ncbi:hypothetical protein T459_26103 [Capsicum annuum]|uniref:Transmembrane protein n=1 Tax=Capsicum annuum TaxID=4072 RepID=A0A2G2YMK1_CAPAN|nr:hypothetical protein T459_26103 [Capsicum annuum]